MSSKPSKINAIVFDEDSLFARVRPFAIFVVGFLPVGAVLMAIKHWWLIALPLAIGVMVIARLARKRTLIIGVEGFVLKPRHGRARFVAFDAFESVQVMDNDVIVRVSMDSNIRLRTEAFDKAHELHDTLKRWFEIHNDLLFDADDIEPNATTYREAALDPSWAIAFSPGRPFDERARAAIDLLRDERATHTANAQRLARIASASARASFSALVHSLMTREPLAFPARVRIARDLGLRVDELDS